MDGYYTQQRMEEQKKLFMGVAFGDADEEFNSEVVGEFDLFIFVGDDILKTEAALDFDGVRLGRTEQREINGHDVAAGQNGTRAQRGLKITG